MSASRFQPARLRLARELRGQTQAAVARAAGLTPAAVSQFESGAARPSGETADRLAVTLGVPTAFFAVATLQTHEGFFRSLKRTAVADRRRARALAHVAHDLASDPAVSDQLPVSAVPDLAVDSVEDDRYAVEELAARARLEWGLAAGPVGDLVAITEEQGIVPIRLPLDSTDVDAFSLPFDDRPVVVLSADKNDRARSRFDLAHEVGHLVMHGQRLYGLKEIEQQAHWFAGAFLMPAAEIYDELPRRVDWKQFFDLKTRWQTSLAALLMRARTLETITEAQYLTAIKTASARGWRRNEPVPIGEPERPRLLSNLMRCNGGSMRDALPPDVLDALAAAAGGDVERSA